MSRIAIAGAGALGSIYGGLLAAAGRDVVFLAHGAHEEALRKRPLVVEIPTGALEVRVAVEDETEADVVILTAKTFDTYSVLERIRGEPALAISVQNGPGKNDGLIARFGRDAVAGAVSSVGAELVAPGVVRSANLGHTYVGELDGRTSSRVASLVEAITDAGLEAKVTSDVLSAEWSKHAQVTALMAVQIVTGLYVHKLLITTESARLVKRIIEEVAVLARAIGVDLGDWPVMFPVGAVARADETEGLELLADAGERMREGGATAVRTSMLQSLQAGRRTELEAIHGEVVRRARQHGVPATATEICYRLVRRCEQRTTSLTLSSTSEAAALTAERIGAAADRRKSRAKRSRPGPR